MGLSETFILHTAAVRRGTHSARATGIDHPAPRTGTAHRPRAPASARVMLPQHRSQDQRPGDAAMAAGSRARTMPVLQTVWSAEVCP